MPGPEAFLGHCSAITEQVHLGSAIFNITPKVNKPVRIAENVALLDHLSNNRFEFGTGRGSSTTEVYGFDIEDIDEHKPLWREAIARSEARRVGKECVRQCRYRVCPYH